MTFRQLVERILEIEGSRDKSKMRQQVAECQDKIEKSLSARKISKPEHDILYELIAKTTHWYY